MMSSSGRPPHGDDGGTWAGEAYVLFGKARGIGAVDATGRRVVDLTDLSLADGFVIQGDDSFDWVGYSVSSAGDVNGDGYDDLIVGAPWSADGGALAGEAYVLFGKAGSIGTVDATGRRVVDLTDLSPADGFVIQGDAVGDSAGWSVSSAGDVNKDGYDDVIVGAPFGDDGGTDAGDAYVLFGKAGGFGAVDATSRRVVALTDLSPADGFVIQGDAAGDGAGWGVSTAGDVNGDGYDDVIVGAPKGDDGGTGAGEAYVLFGKAGGFGTVDATGRRVVDLTDLWPADGFVIQGDAAGDGAGWSVSSAEDVNRDGYDDLIVGAPEGDDGGTDAGEAYVLFGKAGEFGTVGATGRRVVDLTDLSSADGFVIQGDAVRDHAGWSVSSAGDVNKDGYDDFIVGVPNGDDERDEDGGDDVGEAYIIFGGLGIGQPDSDLLQ